jgi:hypothetical protein
MEKIMGTPAAWHGKASSGSRLPKLPWKFGLVFIGLAASLSAQAITVQIDGFRFSPAKPLTTVGPASTGDAGQFTGTQGGTPFSPFGAEPGGAMTFSAPLSGYTLVDGVTAWGATKSADIDRALSNFLAFGQPSSATLSASAQAILWEILFENPANSYSLASGDFRATSSDSSTQFALNAVNWAALSVTPIVVHASLLSSPQYMDLITIAADDAGTVPLPGSLALMGLGLFGLSLTRQRRKT